MDIELAKKIVTDAVEAAAVEAILGLSEEVKATVCAVRFRFVVECGEGTEIVNVGGTERLVIAGASC